jgi:tetratricopeptide (TPR) repeat protein
MMLRDKAQRRIVPRWRPSGLASLSADFASLKGPPVRGPVTAGQKGEAVRAFNDEHSLGAASEALTEALLEGNVDAAKRCAVYIRQNAASAPALLLRQANEAAGGELPPPTGALEVARWRSLLKLSPRNAAVWADMSRHYSSQGDKKQAMRCMQTALQLAPDHRWMLRTASRFLVHQQDYAGAHKLLANHPRTKSDPWLMAAELACAHIAGKVPKSWKAGNDALRYDRFSAMHVSELATAIGMMELEGGNRKQARKLVQRGLIAPTENTLAQVIWAKEAKHLGDGIVGLDKLVSARGDAFEASYKIGLRQGDLQRAIKACQRWMEDEPFAARPKMETTYVASLLDDFDLIDRIAQAALKTDGKLSHEMEMNVIFAELSSGRIDAKDPDVAAKTMSRLKTVIDIGGPSTVHATANLALLNYRSGRAEVGRDLYRAAIDLARKQDGFENAALAATFAAREAILAGDPEAEILLDEATELAKRAGSEAAHFYNRKLKALIAAPNRAGIILSPSSTDEFLKPVRILKVSRGATGFILTIGRS